MGQYFAPEQANVRKRGNQLDAMMFWDRFEGKWRVGGYLVFPERPDDLPKMKEPERPGTFRRKAPDLRR